MGNEALRSASKRSFRKSKNHSKNSGQNYITEDDMDKQTHEEPIQKPSRGMERIRKSLSFRRKKKSLDLNHTDTKSENVNTNSNQQPDTGTKSNLKENLITNVNQVANPINENSSVKPELWIEDEKKVKTGNCSFQVKYLGFQEVSDSRGMHVCEMAIEKLLAEKEKKKPIKAILYVSGDSLRVVDESNKTLLVDQTIEKVSFCAPDRHHENGFAYICRDGTARRWLCHCFMAIKDTLKGTGVGGTGCSGGERLSHAVGCAFSVCLEKKQKRERENVSMEIGPNHSFIRFGSFRQASLTERFEDPQIVMPAAEPVPIKHFENPHAIERPKPSSDAFNRNSSLRNSGALPITFKRNSNTYSSLRPSELPSFKQQKLKSEFDFQSDINNQTNKSLLTQNGQNNYKNLSSLNEIENTTNFVTNQITSSDLFKPIESISEIPEDQEALKYATQTDEQKIGTKLSTDYSKALELTAQLNLGSESNQELKDQKQYYHMSSNPSVFTTPVSPNFDVFSNNLPPTIPALSFPENNIHNNYTGANKQLQSLPYNNQNSNLLIKNNLNSSTFESPLSYSNNIISTPNSNISFHNQNETFEQKWARIQAAKKTNPFAEDIAKKFEIKL